MKATLVNMSRWRSDHIAALYEAALTQVESPIEPSFLVVTDGYYGACIEVTRTPDVIRAQFSHSKTGEGSDREGSALEALATGRTLDEGTFGQLAKYFVNKLGANTDSRPSRTVPRWARDLPFTEREIHEEAPKVVSKLQARSSALGFYRDITTKTVRYITTDDVPAILKYARLTAAIDYRNDLDHALARCRDAREQLRKARSDDRRHNRYIDRMERLDEARRAQK